jgi:hypothetical protein
VDAAVCEGLCARLGKPLKAYTEPVTANRKRKRVNPR